MTSVGNVGRAATTARGIGRSAREQSDIGRAREKEARLREEIVDLEEKLQEASDPFQLIFKSLDLRPRKSDIDVSRIALLWTPWEVGPEGIATAAYS